jgi:hypothetical protein
LSLWGSYVHIYFYFYFYFYFFECGEKGPHIHWLDDMPLALVLITAADAGCTGMGSGESRTVQKPYPWG